MNLYHEKPQPHLLKEVVYKEYPKMLYIDNEKKIVHNKEEELALVKDNQNEPASKNISKGSNSQKSNFNRNARER